MSERGKQHGVDEVREVRVIDVVAVEDPQDEHRADDLFVGEGVGVERELAASDSALEDRGGETGAGGPGCVLQQLAQVGVLYATLQEPEDEAALGPLKGGRQAMAKGDEVADQRSGVNRRQWYSGAGLHRGGDQFSFVRPPSVDRRLRGPGAVGDGFDRQRLVAVLCDEFWWADLPLLRCTFSRLPTLA